MHSQSVGIFGSTNLGVNSTGAKGNVKAVFDISSSDKGLLIPRITTASRDTFTNIPTSLLFFNTTTNQYEYWNGGSWAALAISGSSIISLNGLTATAQTFSNGATGTTPNWSSAASIHTLNIPMAAAAGVTAGLLSKTDYDVFNNKLSISLADGNIWIGDGTGTAKQRIMSGDATLSNTGVLTIGTGAITSAKIADGTIANIDIANGTIAYSKIQNVTASRLLGNPTGVGAAPSEIPLGTGLAFSGGLLTATNNGTVTSVGLSAPAALFSVTGSPVVNSGTLGLNLNNQSANTVFAAPSGGAGLPSFRTLTAFDIPSLDASKITTGTFGIARGGTNNTTLGAAGSVFYSNGTQYASSAVGTAGQVLTSGGAGAPTWVTSGTLSGGTANYIPKWTSATGLSSTSLIFDDGTNVGIGTTLPGVMLDVVTPAVGPSSPTIRSQGFGNPAVNITRTNGTGGTLDLAITDGSPAWFTGGITSGDAVIKYGSGKSLKIGNNSGAPPQVTIDASGSVGIGSTSPTQKLDVFGNGTFYGSNVNTSTPALRVRNTNGGSSPGSPVATSALFAHASSDGIEPKYGADIAATGGTGTGNVTGLSAMAAGASSNDVRSINVSVGNGANNVYGVRISATNLSAINTYGIQSVTSGANTGTNYAGYFSASGATNNYAIVVPSTGGNVGIGTTSPLTKLHIQNIGSVGFTPSISFDKLIIENAASSQGSVIQLVANATSGTSGIGFSNTTRNTGFINYTHATNYMFLGTNSATRMTISSTGNVGIGTTSPGLPLDISYGNASGGVAETGLRVRNTSTTNSTQINLNGFRSWSISVEGSTGAPAGGFTITDYTASANRFCIDNAGNVGIGTTAPSGALTVSKSGGYPTTQLRAYSSGSTFDAPVLQFNRARGTGAAPTAVLSGDELGFIDFQSFNASSFAGLAASIGALAAANHSSTSSPAHLRFFTAAVGSTFSLERMRITSDGNVGIGTTAPSHRLHVIGTAGLSTGTAWTNTSDARLKTVHGNYERGLSEIIKLNTVRFNYKKDNPLSLPSDKEIIGFVAQDVEKVIPEAVVYREDGYMELNVDPIHWAAINAIKELNKKIEDQQKIIDSLKKEVGSWKLEVRSLQKENSTLKSEITSLKTSNVQLQTEVEKIKEYLEMKSKK